MESTIYVLLSSSRLAYKWGMTIKDKTKQPQLVQTIDFTKLRRDLRTLMKEVDLRLKSEFDSFSPNMWRRLQRTVDGVVVEINAVRLCLNGYSTAEVAQKLGLKKQQVAAYLAYNTMWQSDYASPETIISATVCPHCKAGIGVRCLSSGNQDARVHDSRRQQFRDTHNERALNMKAIRKQRDTKVAA